MAPPVRDKRVEAIGREDIERGTSRHHVDQAVAHLPDRHTETGDDKTYTNTVDLAHGLSALEASIIRRRTTMTRSGRSPRLHAAAAGRSPLSISTTVRAAGLVG
ncbi:MAG: hypothetical protein ACRDR6_09425 [Pseudonocardiaceae bacterium]